MDRQQMTAQSEFYNEKVTECQAQIAQLVMERCRLMNQPASQERNIQLAQIVSAMALKELDMREAAVQRQSIQESLQQAWFP